MSYYFSGIILCYIVIIRKYPKGDEVRREIAQNEDEMDINMFPTWIFFSQEKKIYVTHRIL